MNRTQRRANQATARRQPAAVPASDLPDEARRWIAEQLLLGTERKAIIARMHELGTPPSVTQAEIAAAEASPYFQGAAVLGKRIAKRDWLLRSQARLAVIDGGLDAVERAHQLPADRFFADYYARHRPVLLTGLIDDWPAMRLWSLDYFEDILRGAVVQVQTRRESNAAYESQAHHHREEMPIGPILTALRSDIATNDFYVTAGNANHNRTALARLWDDIAPIPGYLDPRPGEDGFFWMGPKGTVTPFHHDLTNNLLLQIRGRKEVTLVPSWETPRMRNARHCFSGWTSPEELEAAPTAERPATLRCVIEPGEVLFIPVGWWHHVVGLDMTIGMSFTNFARDNDFYSDYDCYGDV